MINLMSIVRAKRKRKKSNRKITLSVRKMKKEKVYTYI